MAENNTTYYQSRHTGTEIDNLLDQSIAATAAANASSEKAAAAAANANEEAAKIPGMVAGKADLDPATGYVEPSQLAPLEGRQTGVQMGGGHFRSTDAALLLGGDISVAVTLRIGALPTATTFIFADQSGVNLNRLFFAAYNGKVVARFATQTLIDRSVEADSLYQLVVSISKGGQMSGYVNSLPYTTRTDVSSPSEPNAIVVGGTTRNTELFDGTLLGLRIFDYALSASEVAALWNGGQPERYMLPLSGAMRDGLVAEYIPAGLLADKWRDTSGAGLDLSYVPTAAGGTAAFDYQQQPLTPSGSPLHDLFVGRGAVWNANTGYWELNGLTDITNKQMVDIYNIFSPENLAGGAASIGTLIKARTNFPFFQSLRWQYAPSLGLFVWNTSIEVIRLSRSSTYQPSMIRLSNGAVFGFDYFDKLKRIEDVIYAESFKGTISFLGCVQLEHLRISQLISNINIGGSSKISLETLQYLVENAGNTAAITVTVHADLYAKLTDPTNTEWYAVNAAAQAKQISFATA